MKNKLLEAIIDDDDDDLLGYGEEPIDGADNFNDYMSDSYDDFLSDSEMSDLGYEKVKTHDENEDYDFYGSAPWSHDEFRKPDSSSKRTYARKARDGDIPNLANKTWADENNGDDGAFIGDENADIGGGNADGAELSYKDLLKHQNVGPYHADYSYDMMHFNDPENPEFDKDHTEEVDYDPDELFERVLASGKKNKKLDEGIEEDYMAAQFRAQSVVKSFVRDYGEKMTRMAFEQVLPKKA